MERCLVATPKSFFIKERDGFYADWTISFFRELFQNSVDADSKNIRIEILETKDRGSFDEAGNPDRGVTRVVFADDGCGMTQDVLDKVYFAIGQTTKDDGLSVGGYGRARLMTCFSQERYSILTTDRFVMGDGPDYVNYSLDEAEDALSRAIERIEGEDEAADLAREGLRSDLAMVRAAKTEGGFKGCRVEVDIENKGGWYAPTAQRMSDRLRQYLSESQIPCAVQINGRTPEEYFGSTDKIQARRGPVKRVITANIRGEIVPFATVHTSEGAKAHHKGKMIVRVDGASMFTTAIEAKGVQVILEIKKELSREVLNSNRDGLKADYADAVNAFVAELNIDNASALADRKSKDNYTIQGERGLLVAAPPSLTDISSAEALPEEREESFEIVRGDRKIRKIDSLATLQALGLSSDAVETFIRQTFVGRSFLNPLQYSDDFPLAAEAEKFVRTVYQRGETKPVETFLSAPDSLKEWMANVLVSRTEKAMAEVADQAVKKIKDLHDVHVAIVSANEKTRAAIRRNDPRKWSVKEGRGRAPRALLSAWTAACSVAVETLMRARPATHSFNWTTGWVYSVPEEKHQGDRYRDVAIEAMCQVEGDNYRFLLNPVNDDGTLKYSPSNKKDRQRLQSLAMHEVAHVLEHYHNETFAGVLTDLMAEYDFSAANRRMKDAVTAVMAAYENGKARVQAMDSEPGLRPAERLMALASANEPGMTGEAVERHSDGTWTVDADKLQDHVPWAESAEKEEYIYAASAR